MGWHGTCCCMYIAIRSSLSLRRSFFVVVSLCFSNGNIHLNSFFSLRNRFVYCLIAKTKPCELSWPQNPSTNYLTIIAKRCRHFSKQQQQELPQRRREWIPRRPMKPDMRKNLSRTLLKILSIENHGKDNVRPS